MKTLLLVALSLIIFNMLPNASAGVQISCSHPELCRLAKIVFNENKIADAEFISLVKVVGDPHEFEPGIAAVKDLIKAPILIAGPMELNPWIKKINYQRSKISDLRTMTLPLESVDYDLYPGATPEALSHFWLYPKIFCALKGRLENQMINLKLLVILPTKKSCLDEEQKIINELKKVLTTVKLPIILTHDALLPLLESIGGKEASIVAIKGSGHHQETSPKAVKKLYDALKAPRVIWIEEIGINVPQNILSKKRPEDLTLKIDTANSDGLHYFEILSHLSDKLKALKP